MTVPGEQLAFEDAVGILKTGGLLLMGTDTLPGFHCRADLPEAVDRILALKGRDAGKSLLVLAGSVQQGQLVTGNLEARQAAYCQRCWPGPFSLILPAGEHLPGNVNSGGKTVAVRVPAVPSLRRLVLAVGFPIISTSANLSGQAPCKDLESALGIFRNQVDGSWQPPEFKSDVSQERVVTPSALIDVTVWPPRELRAGPHESPLP